MGSADLGGGGDVYYQYREGDRARKMVINGSLSEERLYFGGFEIYRRKTGTSLDVQRITVHITDDTGRIAMYEKRTAGSDGSVDVLQRYIYSNHLGTATLELDHTAAIISYEEYHPYGTTAYQAMNSAINAVAKRYRYTGKERDEETGLYYHGARYFVPWLARWCASDPLEVKYAPQSSYVYCSDNPVKKVDPSGMGDEEKSKPQFKGGNDFPLEENYAPVSSTQKMGWDENYTFVSKFGEDVTRYHDDALGRDYSVRKIADATGNERLFSWVDLKTGEASLYTGDNKNAKGAWTGHWVEFESAEKRNVRLANETADALTIGFIATGVGLFALPVGLELFGTQAGLAVVRQSLNFFKPGISGRSAINFAADLTYQAAKHGNDYQKYNITSLAANAVGFNWLVAPLIGSVGEYSIESGFQGSYIFGNKSISTVLTETGTSAAFNKLGEKWLKGTVGSFSANREMYEIFGRKGVNLSYGMTNYFLGTMGNTLSGVITDNK